MTAEPSTIIDRLLTGFLDRRAATSAGAAAIFADDAVAWTAGQPDARGAAAVGELLDAVAASASTWTVTAKIVGEHNAVVELLGTTDAGTNEPLTAVVELAGAHVSELRLYRDPVAFSSA